MQGPEHSGVGPPDDGGPSVPRRGVRPSGGWSGHPLARLAGTLGRLPRYLKLGRALVRDPSIPPGRKAALALGIGYALSPIDLIPGVIPVAGQLDDLAALLLGLRHVLRGCPPDAAAAYLDRAGLSNSALDEDIQTVRDAAEWLLARAVSLGGRAFAASRRLIGRASGPARARLSRPRATRGNGPPSAG